MATIQFTQYLRPHGRPVETSIERPDDIGKLAQAITNAGFRFESEELMNGTVSLTICSPDEGDLAIELCPNGPEVPLAVDRLITGFRLPASVEGE